MICPQCRTQNADESIACSKCGSAFDFGLDADGTLDITPKALDSSGAMNSSQRAVASSVRSASSSRTGARTAVTLHGGLEPGDELGHRYRIESMLGQGGMGRVYRAYDIELDRPVALKVLQPELTSDPNAMQRFKQELLLASRISHKNILRIHDLGDADNIKFISMAFVDGQDLHHLLRAGKLSIERAENIAQQLCEALDAAHSEGIVHRDLKPQNVLMGEGDHVYVSDFGLAKSFESSSAGMTRTGQFLGTPRYMAPEQVETGHVDQRTDLYALGLILFEMVTGEDAFKGDSTLQIMYRRVKEKPPNPRQVNPEVPEYLSRIILRCLERDPASRYQHASEILADLRAARVTPASKGLYGNLNSAATRWWIGGAVAIALIAVAVIPTVRYIFRSSRSSSSAPSTVALPGVPPLSSGQFIAVLPLQVLGDPRQIGYLAEGIREALSAKLFQLKDVRITSADQAAKANQNKPLPEIASTLGANLLVQGMLQSSGDQIRVIVNLEDVADGKRLLSKEFNGIANNLFAIEDQIYNQLVSALNDNPTVDEIARASARPTYNLAAYDLYLRGQNDLKSHQAKDIQSALDYFSQAVAKDPSFALAYSGVAEASLRMYGIKKDSFWTDKALGAAEQAKALNDKLPEVHFALGSTYSETGKYDQAVVELKRATVLAPNSDEAYLRLGDAYLQSGNAPAALQAFQKAIQLNPYFWTNQDELGNAYFQQADYTKALEAFHQITVLAPDIDVGYENIGNVYLQQGKYKDCIPYYQKALQIEPYWTTYSNLGTAYFFLKQYPDAAAAYEKAVALNPNDSGVVVNLADAYRWAGQQDKAKQTYQQAITLGYKELQTNPQSNSTMAQIALSYAKIGDAQHADSFISRARASAKNNVDYIYDQAEIEAILNRQDAALKALREALEKHYSVDYASGDQELENLQANPKFLALIKEFSAKKP
ncbi:MAG TPA: tetratricopeptide repeat protein [Candidatus Acidoferrales bacterium]|nr:tetratricopeptide repeat protein [Candidatus Acidoferrales bacterium]